MFKQIEKVQTKFKNRSKSYLGSSIEGDSTAIEEDESILDFQIGGLDHNPIHKFQREKHKLERLRSQKK